MCILVLQPLPPSSRHPRPLHPKTLAVVAIAVGGPEIFRIGSSRKLWNRSSQQGSRSPEPSWDAGGPAGYRWLPKPALASGPCRAGRQKQNHKHRADVHLGSVAPATLKTTDCDSHELAAAVGSQASLRLRVQRATHFRCNLPCHCLFFRVHGHRFLPKVSERRSTVFC